MIYIKRLLNSVIISGVLLLGGCAAYHPAPITPESVPDNTTDMNEVRIQADEFSHPLLEPVHFDDRDGLSPEEAAILAVIANPALRAIRDRRGLASAQLLQAGLLPNPQLSYDLGIPVGGNTAGRVNRHDLSLGWEITSLIARGANMDAARARLASVDLEVAWQEWQVAEAARLHLYRLIIAEKRLAAAKKAAASFQRFFEDVKQSVTLGLKTRLDLAGAETIRREAGTQVLNAQLTLDRERLSLNQALGFPAGKVIPLQKNIVPRLKECPPVETLFREAEAGRFDLLALKLGYESQEARLRSAVRSQFPKINLGLAGGRDTDDIQTVGVGVSIDLPFFDRNQGRIAEERASRKQLFDEYTTRLFETRGEIDRLLLDIASTRRQIINLDESLGTLKKLTDNSRRAADAGELDIFSYYQAMRSLSLSQIQRIELEQRIIDLGIALEIASGRYGLVGEAGSQARKEEQITGAEESR